MKIIIVPTSDEVGRTAASRIATVVAADPTAVVGLATGSSPDGVYAELERRVRAGEISFARARGFALDEYVGLPADHPESYANVIDRSVVRPLGFDPSLVSVPDGRADDLQRAAADYEEAIRSAGGVDIQILGIGSNGHIGFNEPGSAFTSRTRVQELAERTRQDNARFFDSPDQVPTQCLTQGIGTILQARKLLLVAQGAAKAEAIAAAVEGPAGPELPASALQQHPDATIVIEEAAAGRLRHRDRYRCE